MLLLCSSIVDFIGFILVDLHCDGSLEYNATFLIASDSLIFVLLSLNVTGAMEVLVHLDMLFITENCSLDWSKVHGVGKYIILQPVGLIQQPLQNQVC